MEIKTGEPHYRDSVWFYTWEIYHASDLLTMKIDGKISIRIKEIYIWLSLIWKINI